MLVSLVLERQFGKNEEGDVIQVDEDTSKSLCDSGIARLAEEGDLHNDEEKDENDEVDLDEDLDEMKQFDGLKKKAFQAVKEATKKAVEKANKPQVKRPSVYAEVKDTKSNFINLGAFAKCVAQAEYGDSSARRKMGEYQKYNDNRLRTKGYMATTVTADGGTLVPQEWSKEIATRMNSYNSLLNLCTKYPMEHQTMNIPSVNNSSGTSGVRAYWVDEATTITDSKAVTENVQLSLQRLAVLVNASDEILRFNAFGLETFLLQHAPQKAVYEINKGILTGTGSQVNLIGNAATVAVSRDSATRISFNDIINMYSRCYGEHKNNAIWITSSSNTPELYKMAFPSASGSYPVPIYLPVGNQFSNLAFTPSTTLLGRPVFICESAKAVGVAGDLTLVDMSAIAAGYVETEGVWSPHLYWDKAISSFRFMWYLDTVSPIKTAYTNEDGTTASHIVRLASNSSSG